MTTDSAHELAVYSNLSASLVLSSIDQLWLAARGQGAEELKRRFNHSFWMEDKKFFALGLDSTRRQISSIASNGGNCIATGIVDNGVVEATADRLFTPDMFSGLGHSDALGEQSCVQQSLSPGR